MTTTSGESFTAVGAAGRHASAVTAGFQTDAYFDVGVDSRGGLVGVRGVSETGVGVVGRSEIGEIGGPGEEMLTPGVRGENGGYGAGVEGFSEQGVGGSFSSEGSRGGLHLEPRLTVPESPVQGDLYVDQRGTLWFCPSDGTWKQVQLV